MARSFEYYPGYGFRLVHVTSGTEGPSFHEISCWIHLYGEHTSPVNSRFQEVSRFHHLKPPWWLESLDMHDLIILPGFDYGTSGEFG